MTAEKYIEMESRFSKEIDINKIPPSLEDFPEYVCIAIELFNALSDTYCSSGMSSLYTGKNYSSLPMLFELFGVDDQEDKLKIFEVIQFLDGRARETALKEAKKASKK